MTLKISIVVGNPKPKSRTLKVAETLAEKLFGPAARAAEIIDLADYRDEILNWPSERMDALNARVAASDVVIFASPTYKATYTGLLKVFLDRYPANGLSGVTAIPLLTGADQMHAMGPTVNLAPATGGTWRRRSGTRPLFRDRTDGPAGRRSSGRR